MVLWLLVVLRAISIVSTVFACMSLYAGRHSLVCIKGRYIEFCRSLGRMWALGAVIMHTIIAADLQPRERMAFSLPALVGYIDLKSARTGCAGSARARAAACAVPHASRGAADPPVLLSASWCQHSIVYFVSSAYHSCSSLNFVALACQMLQELGMHSSAQSYRLIGSHRWDRAQISF